MLRTITWDGRNPQHNIISESFAVVAVIAPPDCQAIEHHGRVIEQAGHQTKSLWGVTVSLKLRASNSPVGIGDPTPICPVWASVWKQHLLTKVRVRFVDMDPQDPF